MTFANEFIPASDIVKFGIEEIDRRYFAITFKPHWTIDRDREIYLRCVASGREEAAATKDFTFYWRGTLLAAQLHEKATGPRNGTGQCHYSLLKLDIPTHLVDKREEVLADLRNALTAYAGGGVYSSWTNSITTFDF